MNTKYNNILCSCLIEASLSEHHSSEIHGENSVCAYVCHRPAHNLFAVLTLAIITFDFDAHASCVADIILHQHNKLHQYSAAR